VVEIALEDPSLIDVKVLKEVLKKYNLEPVICGAFGPTRDLTNEDPAVTKIVFRISNPAGHLCSAGNRLFCGPMYAAVGKARLLAPDQRKKEWELAVKKFTDRLRNGSNA
jgi:D-psicose/D-tagatose/L-ribulose 3-epimerase